MRILFVLHQFFPEFSGGTEQVTLGLARMMQKAGHCVRVLACSLRSEAHASLQPSDLQGAFDTVYQGVPVTLVPRALLPATADFSLDIAPDLVAPMTGWMRAQQFNLVHVTHSMRMATALQAAAQAGLPHLLTLTDFFLPCPRINLVNIDQQLCSGPQAGKRCSQDCKVPPWSSASLEDRYRSAEQILSTAAYRVVPSDYVASRYREAFPGLGLQTLAHGLDLLAWLKRAPTSRARGPEMQLAFVGSLVPQKGLHVLLKALAQLPGAPFKLAIAGAFNQDAAYEREIRSLVASDSRATLLGALDHDGVGAMLVNSDVLCLPSTVPESYSLTLREAALLGVPALVSDLGAQRDFVQANGGGCIVAAGSVAAWSQALSALMAEPQNLTAWKQSLPLPMRIEEEAFLYESLYRQCAVVTSA